jgi:hypothetical protein
MIFGVIKAFVNDIGEFFAKDSHPLALYERLINKTSSEHTEAIEKHIVAFRKFCTDNDDNISNKVAVFTEPIFYSQRVYIDMNEILKLASNTDATCIWKHLLTISALLNPTGKAYHVLKSSEVDEEPSVTAVLKPECDGEEGEFLVDIISKVEKHVKSGEGITNSDPQAAIASIMSSGLITDLVGSLNNGISSGKLDLAKMMTSVQKMVGNLSAEMGEDNGMLGNMMGMMNMMNPSDNTSMDPQNMPDISSLMGMIMPKSS